MTREILIAEPDLTDQGEFQRIFESTDYRVVFSENSEDAFFSIRLLKPDLVIASLALSEKTGFELCEAVKKDPELSHIPFVLLSGIFEDIPEQERERVGANGVLSKPLVGEEVLTLVDRLVTKETAMAKEEEVTDRDREWKSFAEMKNEELSLASPEEMDEEIIELVDVVEEPEPRMTIDDFVSGSKEEPGPAIPPIEPWARSFGDEGGEVAAAGTSEEEKPSEEELLSGLEQMVRDVEEPVALVKKEAVPEEELFERIELEEILERVEMLKPALEKEWPSEKKEPEKAKRAEVTSPEKEASVERDWSREASEEKTVASAEGPSAAEATEKKPMGFDEFEALLKKDLGIGSLEEEGIEPLSLEEAKAEPPKKAPVEEEPGKKEDLEKLAEEIEALEGKPETVAEPLTSLDEFEELLKKGLGPEAAGGEGLEPFPSPSIDLPVEEELSELKEEEFPESFLEELEEELEEEALEDGEVSTTEDLLEEELEVLDEIEPFELMTDEVVIPEVAVPVVVAPGVAAREVALPAATSPTETMAEELAIPIELPQEITAVSFKEGKEVFPPLEVAKEIVVPAERLKEVAPPPVRPADRQIQEVIANGIQVMIGDFITKILPEMTQSILDLTAERIEKMVKEIVPELAEKAIQAEIKRLQKGEK